MLNKILNAKKDFVKKYQNLVDVYSKNLENRAFLIPPSNDGHMKAPRADKVSKMILKVV